MQSASDIFLRWTQNRGDHFYVRQLWDGKIKPAVQIYDEDWMLQYADACGCVLLERTQSQQIPQSSAIILEAATLLIERSLISRSFTRIKTKPTTRPS